MNEKHFPHPLSIHTMAYRILLHHGLSQLGLPFLVLPTSAPR